MPIVNTERDIVQAQQLLNLGRVPALVAKLERELVASGKDVEEVAQAI